jgi:hypothetical protein
MFRTPTRRAKRTARDVDGAADDSFETLARDGANACRFGAAMGFERELYAAFGLRPGVPRCAWRCT